MGMANDPFANGRVTEVVRSVARLCSPRTEAYAQAAGPAEPPILLLPNQSSAFNVPSSAVNDVARPDEIPRKTAGVVRTNSRYPVFDNSIVPDVLWHDRRNSVLNVVRGVKLAAKRTSLNVASPSLTGFA